MKLFALTTLLLTLGLPGLGKTVKLSALPPVLQQAITENAKGGEIRNISTETEKGVTEYEVETILNGKHRDFNLDRAGKLLAVEEEVDVDSIPAAAKAALLKKIGTGKRVRVEAVTEGSATS